MRYNQVMHIVITIEARMNSSRLPGKVLLKSCGKSLLQHMIERLQHSQLADKIIVATTTHPADDAIVDLCEKINCSYFRGSEKNVTDRLIKTAEHIKADLIVQTTSDCPFHEGTIIDNAIEFYKTSQVDYVSNHLYPSWPLGLATQVYKPQLLLEVAKQTQDPEDLEHGSYYIYTHPEQFSLKNFKSEDIYHPTKRWTLDYPEDYTFINSIYEELYPSNKNFTCHDILNLLKTKPELEAFNQKYVTEIVNYGP
jgi:spore coat polysaccharide biosynthesis protein SpsF